MGLQLGQVDLDELVVLGAFVLAEFVGVRAGEVSLILWSANSL